MNFNRDQFDNSQQLNTEVPQMNVLDLNDDCLDQIFRYLNTADLATISETCKTFQQIAVKTFKSKKKNSVVFLCNNTKAAKFESSRILRQFGRFLQKVNIDFGGDKTNDKFIDVIVDKCNLNLFEVEFSGIEMEIIGKVISKILNKRNISRFIAKFSNLKRLRFGVLADKLVDAQCIQQKFPNLEHLSVQHPFDDRNLKNFMESNVQVNSLELDNDFRSVTRHLIMTIDKILPHLEQLELKGIIQCGGAVRTMDYQPLYLNNLKRLVIRDMHNGKFLPNLAISNKKVEEFIIEVDACNDRLINFICQYKFIRKLVLCCGLNTFYGHNLLQLSESLPNLSEVEVRGYDEMLPIQNIVKFIQRAKQLTKVALKPFSMDLNEVKQKLDPHQWVVTQSDATLKLSKLYK